MGPFSGAVVISTDADVNAGVTQNISDSKFADSKRLILVR